VISRIVVNRGDVPVPPGERLELRSPEASYDQHAKNGTSESNDGFKYANFHIQL
jgi:hypothetical protein